MKYLKLFESISIIDEIKEDLIYISDNLGQPSVKELKYGNSKKYYISWDLGINFKEKQKAELFIKKIKLISEEIEDVISLSKKLKNYEFIIYMNNRLCIEIIPKKQDHAYKFIDSFFNSSCLMLSESEIERFFINRDIIVNEMELDNDVYGDTKNHLLIGLDKLTIEAYNEFQLLLNEEFNRKQKDEFLELKENDLFIMKRGNYIKILILYSNYNIDLAY